ncbi:methionine ABC transporter ATP-binding protein [Bombilactobacillus thymidiniphilus]|uniref:Methionine ABC transporter ATP-binding protein n=1 Tax=Bombilactobacillus thymidiniphilus TaxID=2923363 RepID=A0ABY4PEI6_9LACO|nr:methionine ABC transporter ATP-binding protein [Bombilactobacillus thymidiniphilus]UQS83697.1 methionine ABC transporter ATP-binding protein [Bombilactobacillus thymidiniphilus]
MTENNAIIKLRNIDVDFGSHSHEQTVRAVNQVDLTVQQGNIYGIIGYSGAGKSTLVRVINLLQTPTHGTVHVNGQDLLQLSVAELRQARKKIGMIFQHFNLMEARTVFSNVAFPLLGSKFTAKQRKQKVTHLLELVGLSDKATSYPSQLSGGQKQRVAIARALANDPQILISDEATSALDPETTTEILNLLKYLNKKLQITIVVITHEMDAIKQICQNVAVMDQGRIIERGSLLQIFGHPQTKIAQQFVNSATQLSSALQEIKQSNLATEVYQLNYVGQVTNDPIVIELYKKFNLQANILFSNIEQLQATTVGIMLVEFAGSKEDIVAALAYLDQLGISVQKIDLTQIEVH